MKRIYWLTHSWIITRTSCSPLGSFTGPWTYDLRALISNHSRYRINVFTKLWSAVARTLFNSPWTGSATYNMLSRLNIVLVPGSIRFSESSNFIVTLSSYSCVVGGRTALGSRMSFTFAFRMYWLAGHCSVHNGCFSRITAWRWTLLCFLDQRIVPVASHMHVWHVWRQTKYSDMVEKSNECLALMTVWAWLLGASCSFFFWLI